MTDQPDRWLFHTSAETIKDARDKLGATSASLKSEPPATPSTVAASGVVDAWLALSPEEQQATGLVPRETFLSGSDSRPRSMSGSGVSRSRSSPLILSSSNDLILDGTKKHKSMERAAQMGAENAEGSAARLSKKAVSSVSSSRPEFWQGGLRRSAAFERAVRGSWAP
eukprot:CAMPEP_0197666694 /NCGR_PEP_ID=MMETSP1338-20131121/63493_1 /TAXON_ID=43686 ORGANISM="Pelagodinium beii, Strain RCC1491" /NCGR_SAMPLE_ID=MMETSP1338 /ASSEMBLY_ACC=CAM_ASM_000754 /LENGTH=167 /DNA_ID=CAMNT_0043245769 /DNA_START=7 /DNA_END=510 /DNA_ORIENTATION=-